MKKLKNICLGILRIKVLKYILVTVLAVVLIGFVDENSLWHHYDNKKRIGELEDEIARYNEQNRRNQEQIRLIDSNPKAMEKIARERYLMKTDDEDIFIISEEEPAKTAPEDETAE